MIWPRGSARSTPTTSWFAGLSTPLGTRARRWNPFTVARWAEMRVRPGSRLFAPNSVYDGRTDK
jgi:hypothetical protein